MWSRCGWCWDYHRWRLCYHSYLCTYITTACMLESDTTILCCMPLTLCQILTTCRCSISGHAMHVQVGVLIMQHVYQTCESLSVSGRGSELKSQLIDSNWSWNLTLHNYFYYTMIIFLHYDCVCVCVVCTWLVQYNVVLWLLLFHWVSWPWGMYTCHDIHDCSHWESDTYFTHPWELLTFRWLSHQNSFDSADNNLKWPKKL